MPYFGQSLLKLVYELCFFAELRLLICQLLLKLSDAGEGLGFAQSRIVELGIGLGQCLQSLVQLTLFQVKRFGCGSQPDAFSLQLLGKRVTA